MTRSLPRVHIVTDDSVLARADFVERAKEIARRHPNDVAVHVRGPRTSGRRIFEIASTLVDDVGPGSIWVNDRVDVARALGTSVHLGRRSLSVASARSLTRDSAWVGLSIHEDPGEISGPDYVFAGPVYETPSHANQPGRGVDWIGRIARLSQVPVLGIGGISAARTGVLLDAGAYGVAVVRAVWDAPDPMRAVSDLLGAATPGPGESSASHGKT